MRGTTAIFIRVETARSTQHAARMEDAQRPPAFGSTLVKNRCATSLTLVGASSRKTYQLAADMLREWSIVAPFLGGDVPLTINLEPADFESKDDLVRLRVADYLCWEREYNELIAKVGANLATYLEEDLLKLPELVQDELVRRVLKDTPWFLIWYSFLPEAEPAMFSADGNKILDQHLNVYQRGQLMLRVIIPLADPSTPDVLLWKKQSRRWRRTLPPYGGAMTTATDVGDQGRPLKIIRKYIIPYIFPWSCADQREVDAYVSPRGTHVLIGERLIALETGEIVRRLPWRANDRVKWSPNEGLALVDDGILSFDNSRITHDYCRDGSLTDNAVVRHVSDHVCISNVKDSRWQASVVKLGNRSMVNRNNVIMITSTEGRQSVTVGKCNCDMTAEERRAVTLGELLISLRQQEIQSCNHNYHRYQRLDFRMILTYNVPPNLPHMWRRTVVKEFTSSWVTDDSSG